MDKSFETRLIEALEALEAGEPLEQVLARYPDEAASLRPILEMALALPALRQEPPPHAEARSRRTFLQTARVFRQQTSHRPFWQGLLRTFGTAAVAAIMVLVVGASLLTLSASALPGDTLYPVKRNFEGLRLLLAPAEERQVFVRQLEQTRLQEIQALLATGREVRVTFEGEVEAMLPEHWVVAGIVVQVDRATAIEGTPLPGVEVEVNGITRQGALYATSIRVLGTVEITPSPSPTPTPTLTLSPSPTPTLTPTPRITPTPAATLTATSAPSQPTVAPPPTATEDGDSDGDDQGGGDDGDNGDDEKDDSDNSGPGGGDDDDKDDDD